MQMVTDLRDYHIYHQTENPGRQGNPGVVWWALN